MPTPELPPRTAAAAPVPAPSLARTSMDAASVASRHWWRPVVNWFDSWSTGQEVAVSSQEHPPVKRVAWVRCLPFLGLHVACLGVIWVGWSWTAVGLALALYALRMFAITGFYHRYFSHKSFRTSRLMQFVFGVLGNSAIQRGPLWWASHHRRHHQVSDQPQDVHSPVQHGLLWSHVGWITSPSNFRTEVGLVRDLVRYPELRFLDRFDTLVPIALLGSLFAAGAALQHWAPELGTSGAQLLIWGMLSTVALFHGTFTINSLSHVFGRRRYATPDQSRNNWWLALITLGEGWHNNHHHYPLSVRQGFYWWEYDLTYYGLWVLARLGLIWDLKPVPQRIRDSGRRR